MQDFFIDKHSQTNSFKKFNIVMLLILVENIFLHLSIIFKMHVISYIQKNPLY